MYRFFDFCIECDFPLPGLPSGRDSEPAWRVSLADDGFETEGFEWFYDWKLPSGSVVMSAARRGDDYLIDCMGVARFRVEFAAGHIAAWPLEGCQENTLAHLLLDQVMPRVVCHLGRPVVHASAVMLDDGRAVAFAGPSGRGKSTLASAFYRSGCQLIADDCLLLEAKADGVQAIPAYPSLRLWQDSLEALLDDEGVDVGRLAEMAHYTSKKQLLLKPGRGAEESCRPPLAALFLLGEPDPRNETDSVKIEAARGQDALMALIEDTFALDLIDRAAVIRGFEAAGALAASLNMFHLDFPRSYLNLSQTVNKIRNFVLFLGNLESHET